MRGKIGQFISVSNMDDSLTFVSDSQDVNPIKEDLGLKAVLFDSFYVETGEGEYIRVYGMAGIIPYNWKEVKRLL